MTPAGTGDRGTRAECAIRPPAPGRRCKECAPRLQRPLRWRVRRLRGPGSGRGRRPAPGPGGRRRGRGGGRAGPRPRAPESGRRGSGSNRPWPVAVPLLAGWRMMRRPAPTCRTDRRKPSSHRALRRGARLPEFARRRRPRASRHSTSSPRAWQRATHRPEPLRSRGGDRGCHAAPR